MNHFAIGSLKSVHNGTMKPNFATARCLSYKSSLCSHPGGFQQCMTQPIMKSMEEQSSTVTWKNNLPNTLPSSAASPALRFEQYGNMCSHQKYTTRLARDDGRRSYQVCQCTSSVSKLESENSLSQTEASVRWHQTARSQLWSDVSGLPYFCQTFYDF